MAKRSKIGIPLNDSRAVFTVLKVSYTPTHPSLTKTCICTCPSSTSYFISGNQKLLAVNRVTSPCYI